MNKHRDSLILIAIAIILISILILLSAQIADADHGAPEVQTQVNKQTDLFQKSVNNLPDFTRELEKGKQVGIDSIGDGTSTPQGLSSITKKSKSELENDGEQLSAINEHELDSKGRAEMIKNNTINELYVDYSRPLNKQHMRDAKTIAEAQNRLLDNLLAILKEKAGIDCKSIKGDKKIEPQYFLQIKTTNHKDTVYNQTFCEELRNTYNCTEKVKLECAEKVNKPFKVENISSQQTENRVANVDGEYNTWEIISKSGPASYVDESADLIVKSHTTNACPDVHFCRLCCRVGARQNEVHITVNFTINEFPLGSKFILVSGNARGIVNIIINGHPIYQPDLPEAIFGAIHGREHLLSLIDASSSVRAGNNTIQIRYDVLAIGFINLKFRATKPVCARWNEKWDEETCALK